MIDASIEICAPRAAVYELSQDYHARLDWDPFLRAVRFLDGATEPAPGVRVWVKARNRMTMVAEYISVKPPERIAVKMVKGPWPLSSFAGTWRFDATTPDRTTARFRYSFELRSLIAPLADRIARRQFQRDMQARLSGLKAAAEARASRESIPGG